MAFEDESKEDIVKFEQSSSSQIKHYIEDDLVPADDQNLQLTDDLEGLWFLAMTFIPLILIILLFILRAFKS